MRILILSEESHEITSLIFSEKKKKKKKKNGKYLTMSNVAIVNGALMVVASLPLCA